MIGRQQQKTPAASGRAGALHFDRCSLGETVNRETLGIERF
jgi:hypothetical protein